LYNTLDTINWHAIGLGATEISRMIGALAQYFRLSLNQGRNLLTLEDELMLARVYLDIQKTRFTDSIEYEIDFPPVLGSCIVPKLTLQPLVENSILHGILKTENMRGKIWISAVLEGEDLVISVTDNGVGMEEGKVQAFLETSEDFSPGREGSYGLYNVNARVQLYAGEAYGLTIHSKPGQGTTVMVRLKAVWKDNGTV